MPMGNNCFVRGIYQCFYCVLIALFCLSSPFSNANSSSIDDSKLLLNVGDHFLCAENNKDITMRCILRCRNVNKTHILATWHLTWRIQGQNVALNSSTLLRNNTMLISTLTVTADWLKDQVFTCFANLKEGSVRGPKLNESLTLSNTKPSPTQVQGVRFIDRSVYKSVEIYWKQSENLHDTYSVQHEVDNEDLEIRKHTIGRDKIECSYRTENIYRVPNTTGRVCKTSINKTRHSEYAEHTVKIITKRGKCETEGPAKKFMLTSYGEGKGSDEDLIVLIPRQVRAFAIHVSMQQVSFTWKHPKRTWLQTVRIYHLEYTCPELGVKNATGVKGGTQLILHSSDFTVYRPYAVCQFCIQVRLEASNVFSEPLCRAARLHEERPSEPPKITCDADCATSNDGRFRNVTVTWSLPSRKAWNGVLTNVKMSYRRADNISRTEFKVVEQNVSQGFTTLSKLQRNDSYVVQTALCNKEGCSEFGSPATLPVSLEQNEPKDYPKSSDRAISSVIIGSLTSAAIFVAILILIILWLIWKKRKNAYRQERHLVLQEPEDYVNINGDQTTDEEYDVLSEDV